MSFNGVSSGSSYYSPYSGVAQFQPEYQGPTNTGMQLDTPIVSANPVAQDQNNPAPVVQPQVEAAEQESSYMNKEIDCNNTSSSSAVQNTPAPVAHPPVQPVLQPYYADLTHVNFDNAIAISKENRQEIKDSIVLHAFRIFSYSITTPSISVENWNVFNELTYALADLKIAFQPIMTELLMLYYQISSAVANGLPVEEIAKLEKKQIDRFNTVYQMSKKLCIDFPMSIQSKELQLRCSTWLVKPVEKNDELIIAPYFTCIAKEKMHVMMFSVPEGYRIENCILKVVVNNYLNEIPFEVDTRNMKTNGRPLKFIIVAIPTEEYAQNDSQHPDLEPTQVRLWFYADTT